jgi:hypothetical protein
MIHLSLPHVKKLLVVLVKLGDVLTLVQFIPSELDANAGLPVLHANQIEPFQAIPPPFVPVVKIVFNELINV